MKRVFFIDVDHCLANFDSKTGDAAVSEDLKRLFPDKPEAAGIFARIFSAMWDFRNGKKTEDAEKFIKIIDSYKVEVPEEIRKPNFMYSRELYMKYISDHYNLNLSGTEIMRIVDVYWDAILKSTKIYDDSLRFLKSPSPKFLIVGSDGRVRFSAGRIIYEPEYAWSKRFGRTMAVFSEFFRENEVIIGDPYDKPSREFWEKCVIVSGVKPKDAFVIDDSIKVVKNAMNFGFKGVLLDRYGVYDKDSVYSDFYAASFDELKKAF